jgi:hypothetical protein
LKNALNFEWPINNQYITPFPSTHYKVSLSLYFHWYRSITDLYDWSNPAQKCKVTSATVQGNGLLRQNSKTGSLTKCNDSFHEGKREYPHHMFTLRSTTHTTTNFFLDTPIFSLFSVGISDVILNLRTESHWCINSFKLSWEYMDIYLVIEYNSEVF